jgi:hypothetical protein
VKLIASQTGPAQLRRPPGSQFSNAFTREHILDADVANPSPVGYKPIGGLRMRERPMWRATYYRAPTDTFAKRSVVITADNEEEAVQKATAVMGDSYRVDVVRTYVKSRPKRSG